MSKRLSINQKLEQMIETIGINAGKVWSVLDANGRQNIKEVKDATKLTYNNLYAALGWLAREGKITLETEKKETYISLVL